MKHSHIWIQVSETRQACTLCSQQRKAKKKKMSPEVKKINDALLDKYCGSKLFNLLAEDD